MSSPNSHDQILVQIASYNTNLQGSSGVPQDLVDWLSPTLQVSSFLSGSHPRSPDIVAVGFQELLPLHLGFSGFSTSVLSRLSSHILSQIETHSPANDSKYTPIAQVVNVGVALLIYARDDRIAKKVRDVQTSWTGCGPCWMGNKGAVGVRLSMNGETYTFVCAHLNAHAQNLDRRIKDFHYIVSTLLFPALPSSKDKTLTTMYSSSHLFFFGDLNFRVIPKLPTSSTLAPSEYVAELIGGHIHTQSQSQSPDISRQLEILKEHDQLLTERRKGSVFHGFKEGEFWRFKCSYKYHLGAVDHYNTKRIPSWTDRILYATYSDDPDVGLDVSNIKNLSYTSIPSYTTSDHKPIVAMLLLPPPSGPDPESTQDSSDSTSTPLLSAPLISVSLSHAPTPDPHATIKRYTGRTVDRIVGIVWWTFRILGAGHAAVGVLNVILVTAVWSWWNSKGG